MKHRPVTTALMLMIALILALPARAQQKAFTQEQVQGMVRSGLGDESGAKLIEQRSIDFAPTEEFLQTLRAVGANEAFLAALRAARRPQPAGGATRRPLDQIQIILLLAGQVPGHRVTMLVRERGIDFKPTNDYLQEVRMAGGEDELISALKGAKVTKPEHVGRALRARQAEIRQHAARGAEFMRDKRYADAETEYRAAVRLQPQDSDLHAALGAALGSKGDRDGEIAEYREALRLNPNNDRAHNNLGVALGRKGDWDEAIAEEREALRLNPNDDAAHYNLGLALGHKGDWDGAIAEEHEALHLNPNDDAAHCAFGVALGHKGDWDGDIAEQREALRLNPHNGFAHYSLGFALEQKGDRQGALQEYRAAYELDPKNSDFRQAYERLLQQINH